jgi:hypothetical protein
MSSPREDVKAVFEQNLLHGRMYGSASRCFERAFAKSIALALGQPGMEWEGKQKEWVLERVAEIAIRAQAFAGDDPIRWVDMARAIRCLVPLYKHQCLEQQPSGRKRQPFGEWCKELPPDFPLEEN